MVADLMKEDIGQRHLSKDGHVGESSQSAWKETNNRIVYDDLNPRLFTTLFGVVNPQATPSRVLPSLHPVGLASADGL